MLKAIENNIWLKIGFFIIVLLTVYYLRNVLLPFAVAFMIAYILNPVVNFFNRWLKKRFFSVVLTLLIVVALLFGFYELIFPSIFSEISSLYTTLKDKAVQEQWSDNIPAFVSEYIKNFSTNKTIEELLTNGNFSKVLDKVLPRITNFFSETFNFLSGIFGLAIVILYIIFIMKDYDEISSGAYRMIPPKYKERFRTLIKRFQKEMSNYLRGQLLVVLCVTILYSVGFSLIGLPMGLTLGIFVGILNLVPYLQIAGFLPAFLLTVIKSVETGSPLWIAVLMTAAVFVVVQIIQDMILTPYIMGKNTGLNPAVILLSLSVWGKILGFLGLILAIPFTCLVITYYSEYIAKQTENKEIEQQE
ncbi:MAG: AI-2E family transporter [Bacteroidales bacterium]|nr:AI-2E family transporter [Bacteroidales bacterium]